MAEQAAAPAQPVAPLVGANTVPEIRPLKTGILYQNPRPHVRSIHAYFPSVVTVPGGGMLATVVLGEAFESTDLHTHLVRSTDNGEAWELQGPIYPGTPERLTTDACRLTALADGELVALMFRHDRAAHPDQGLSNPENMGFVPTELLLLRSRDAGHSWTEPEGLIPPLVGPSFELCCPIVPLSDGRWVLPTSTWRGWDGDCPDGMRMVALISRDRGRTWPEHWEVMRDPRQQIVYWESKIVELPGRELLAVAWAYDEAAGRDLPNQYALSTDGGETWSPPRSTGLLGQTLTPFVLDDGRVLCVYRRMDEPGLWANVSRLDGGEWINVGSQPLWGAGVSGLTSTSGDMVANFHALRFGAPCLTTAADGTIFVAFWCYEECISVIRWFKLAIGC